MKKIMLIIPTILIGLMFSVSFAQEVTLDFHGELNDAAHPDGYRDYVEMGCWQCHGFQGHGGRAAKLVEPLMPYTGFAELVRRPRNVMPAYSPNVLSEEKLRSIYSYLEKIPKSPNSADIPLLSRD